MKHCVKVSFEQGGEIIPKGIFKQKLQFMCQKLLGGVMLKGFMPCIFYKRSSVYWLCLTVWQQLVCVLALKTFCIFFLPQDLHQLILIISENHCSSQVAHTSPLIKSIVYLKAILELKHIYWKIFMFTIFTFAWKQKAPIEMTGNPSQRPRAPPTLKRRSSQLITNSLEPFSTWSIKQLKASHRRGKILIQHHVKAL